jgi:type IV pilus assembly protein PilY1
MKRIHHFLGWLSQAAFLLIMSSASGAAVLSIPDQPLISTSSVTPLVLLDISKDQQLYKKAYNDYSDLDGDGQLDTTYKNSIDYYGYFDSYKCYNYTSGVFVPSTVTSTKYCSGNWSGNFLNWVTMTRIDEVRKLLYGGKRSTDGTGASGTTVLQRSYLPTDAHSWAKYYNGSDISQLTPFTVSTSPTVVTGTSSSINLATLSLPATVTLTVSPTTAFAYGDQVVLQGSSGNYLVGAVSCVNGSGISMYNSLVSGADSCGTGKINVVVESKSTGATGSYTSWSVYDWTQTGMTFCNTTLGDFSGSSGNKYSQTNTNQPLMRVAKGNFALWASNERWQCLWREDTSSPGESTSSLSGATRTNGNRAAWTGLYASSIGPNETTSSSGRIANGANGASSDYNVRVQACMPGLLGQEKCQQYPNGDYKPIGLLQEYGPDTTGANDKLKFGLFTGSYQNNIQGGVLRKNLSSLANEINVTTDGTFASPTGGSIITTLNNMRIFGYCYNNCGGFCGSSGGCYYASSTPGENCPWQQTSITNGTCTSWGNPMGEIFYESLRYLAGKSANSSYAYTSSGSRDNVLGLPEATWSDPLSSSNYCAPLNVLVFNASVTTDDGNTTFTSSSMSDINNSTQTPASLTNTVGTLEGISGNYFVGRSGSSTDELCDAKNVASLGSVVGICPEGPTLGGSYVIAGIAYSGHTNRIRSDITVPSTDTTSLKVSSYGVQLATNVPQINVTLSGAASPTVVIQPAYRLVVSSGNGGGTLVDMKVVSQTATATTASGLIYLNWEDSEQGGDYDQDVWGILSYNLDKAANTISITTKVVAYSTVSPQGFGYIVSGTTKDGPHFHSGILNFNYTDSTGVTGCSNCKDSDAATTYIYTLGTSTGQTLKDPLWYAAKYGGFVDSNGNNKPDITSEWDAKLTNGSPGTDGVPDNYFLVSNPLGLEKALTTTFNAILEQASASAVATNSTSLKAGSRVYQARFNSSSWSGQLLSYRLSTSGSVATSPEWDAGQVINTQVSTNSDSRVILTKAGSSGVAFQWANLTTGTGSEQSSLNGSDTCGQDRLNYLRGWSQNEGSGGTFTCLSGTSTIAKLRPRTTSKLGDIVDSSPWYVGKPSAGYSDIDNPGYHSFMSTYATRKPVVYVGADDGMLHGFDASYDPATNLPTATSGKEVLAYVPTLVYPNLLQLTQTGYSHKYFVDASTMVGDACLSGCTSTSASWKSVLVGGLRSGGRGFYALDVTNPASFSESSTAAASTVMWEFTSSDDSDVGFTFNSPPVDLTNSQPRQIAKLQNGKWAALLGNGYTSTAGGSGHACLFVVYLSGPTGTGGAWTSGTDYVKICADTTSSDNGLSTPTPWDKDGDGMVDTVYAGDLHGNLWKFDLSNMTTCASTPSSCVAYSGTPLYVAKDASSNRQPITYAPDVTNYSGGGQYVFFGTGQFIQLTDKATTAQQTVYAVWDNGASVSGRDNTGSGSMNKVLMTTSSGLRTTTSCTTTTTPSCTPPSSPKGWYLDLATNSPNPSEFMAGNPYAQYGLLFFNTYTPSSNICDNGTSYRMAVGYLDGSTASSALFDTNGDGIVDSSDSIASGIEVRGTLGGITLISGSGGLGLILGSPIGGGGGGGTPGTPPIDDTKFKTPVGQSGRITWHEILQ